MDKLKFVVFDLDGVLVDIDSSWQYIHSHFGVDNETNFKRHLRGEIDYTEFMRSDIGLWNKPSLSRIKSILDKAPLIPGAPETVNIVREMGLEPMILSSGISILSNRVAEDLGIDLLYSNRLLADEKGLLTGEGEEIVPLKLKDRVLREATKQLKAKPRNCITVGNSRFDIPAFKCAGLSIAFNTQDQKTKTAADVHIEGKDLRQIIPWITTEQPKKATISLNMGKREAEAVAASLSPDNLKAPKGVYVISYPRGRKMIVKLTCLRGIETVLATLDDVLASSQLSMETIHVAQKLKRMRRGSSE